MSEWTESATLISENKDTVYRDLAEYNKKDHFLWSYREYPVEQMEGIFKKDDKLSVFLKKMEEGCKLEAVTHYRDPLAAAGYLRIIPKEGKPLWYLCWQA